MKKAVFLDRDGTILREVEYLSRAEDMEILPGAARALRRLGETGYLRLVVTNQSGVARGYFGSEVVEELNEELRRRLKRDGADVEDFAYCPHLPELTGACGCRKPAPGLLLELAARHDVDLAASWMVGDKASDVEAGKNAGCRAALVRTGYGAAEEDTARRFAPDLVADDLDSFADALLGTEADHPAGPGGRER